MSFGSVRRADGLLDAAPRCGACNRDSAGIRRTRKKIKGKREPVVFWESACMEHLRSQAYTDPQTVRVHSRRGYISWHDYEIEVNLNGGPPNARRSEA